MVILNLSCIMEYDRTFLIDKKSPSIGQWHFNLTELSDCFNYSFQRKSGPTHSIYLVRLLEKCSEKNAKLGLTVFFGILLNKYA